jgi:tRNA uridine 5-carboxymethylaminomethyl modification enzyme
VRRDEAVGAVLDRLPKSAAAEEAMADAAYAPYLVRQQQELAARSRDRSVSIPTGFDLGRVPGLSTEMRERLQAAGPSNLDQAARVPGVTPAALAALHFALVRAAA